MKAKKDISSECISNQSTVSECHPPAPPKLSKRVTMEIEQLVMHALSATGRLGDVVEAADICRKLSTRIEEILIQQRVIK